MLTFGRGANIVTAAINLSVLLSCVTVLVATFSVEGGEIHTDISKTIPIRDFFIYKRTVLFCSS